MKFIYLHFNRWNFFRRTYKRDTAAFSQFQFPPSPPLQSSQTVDDDTFKPSSSNGFNQFGPPAVMDQYGQSSSQSNRPSFNGQFNGQFTPNNGGGRTSRQFSQSNQRQWTEWSSGNDGHRGPTNPPKIIFPPPKVKLFLFFLNFFF